MQHRKRSSNSGEADTLAEVARQLADHESFILLPHVGIDGDDLGSMIALMRALEKLGKRCALLSHEKVPLMYHILPDAERVLLEPPGERFDCAVLMECTSPGRLPEGFDVHAIADRIINIDHHPGNTLYADYNYVDCDAAAVGEIVFELLKLLDVSLDYEIAQALYVAIISDTGGFQFLNTKPKTHRIAAALLEYPLNVDEISRCVFRGTDFNVLKLKGEVISTLTSDFDGKLVWGYISQDMMERHAVEDQDIQQFVEDLNVVRGSQIFALFKEAPDRKIRVSLRSIKPPVNEVAMKYKGGGHVLAAGCTVEGPLEKAGEQIRRDLGEMLGYFQSISADGSAL
jgi:phosphoesterase RecJ-like protein